LPRNATSCPHGTTKPVKPLRIPLVVRLGWGLVLGLAACPIPPDFPADAGPDAGTVVDAGVDAGTGASGAISAALTPSDGSTISLAWNGSQVATSALDSASQATLRAVDDSSLAGYGYLTLQLVNLTVGGTTGTIDGASYLPVTGQDSWSCGGATNPCNASLTIGDFDGVDIDGSFQVFFAVDAAGNSATLGGTFDLVL